MTDKPIIDGNAAQVRVIIEQTIASLEASRGKQRASWPAWIGAIVSIGVLIFSAGSLRSDYVSNGKVRITTTGTSGSPAYAKLQIGPTP